MDALTQHRIAAACGNALMCYSEAWMAAWSGAVDQMVELTKEPEQKPSSWFNPAPNGAPFYGPPSEAAAMWCTMAGLPVQTWLQMMPLRGVPTAWPFAYWLIAAGVPKDVAWPTAEGNAAMLEASTLATAEFQTAFAAFRTDGGHSTSVVHFSYTA
jgi:hypothetical protein